VKHIALVAAALLAGCSSLESSRSRGAVPEGLIYYLPKADVQLTVVKTGGTVTAVSIGVTPSYPDFDHRYVLRHERNPVGKSTLNVGVTSGLLQSSRATSVSQIASIATSLGTIAGNVAGFTAAARTEVADTCPDNGTFTFIYPTAASSATPRNACRLAVEIEPLGIDAGAAPADGAGSGGDETQYSGLFFRQNEPYKVTVSNGFDASAIVFSPTRSPTFRLPVKR